MRAKLLGNHKTATKGPSIQELRNERENVNNAIRLATETGEPQPVKIDGKEHNVVSGGYGTEIRPA